MFTRTAIDIALARHLAVLGWRCDVVAPSSISRGLFSERNPQGLHSTTRRLEPASNRLSASEPARAAASDKNQIVDEADAVDFA